MVLAAAGIHVIPAPASIHNAAARIDYIGAAAGISHIAAGFRGNGGAAFFFFLYGVGHSGHLLSRRAHIAESAP